MNAAPARPHVLALLDDAAVAAEVIELSSALAAQLERPLEVVYVESVPALVDAALPFTQVLAEARAQWTAFAPQDVESGYRAQAARLRDIAARATARRAVRWSLRTLRGALPQAVFELHAESDLMVVGTAGVRPALLAAPPPVRRRAPRVALVTDDSSAAKQARQVAQQVAAALGGTLTVHHAAGDAASAAARDRHCDLLVLPRVLLTPAALATLARPALVVG